MSIAADAATRIWKNASRPDLVEALGHMCQAAKREQCIVGDLEHPTKWDLRHEGINELLTLLEHAQA